MNIISCIRLTMTLRMKKKTSFKRLVSFKIQTLDNVIEKRPNLSD